MSHGLLRRPPAWPIVVAGGGVPGLATALALAQALGPRAAVTVFDPAFATAAPEDGRAYALSPASVTVLSALGVWRQAGARAAAVTSMTITDGRVHDLVRPDYLDFAGRDGGPLAFMVEGRDLLPPLVDALRAAGVALVADAVEGSEVVADRRRVRLRTGGALEAALLVVADGARSRLREEAGIGWVGGRYRQRAVVGTVRHGTPHRGRAVQHFLPAGPFAILPLPDEAGRHRSSIVWTESERRVAALLGPDGDFPAELAARFGTDLGPVEAEGAFRSFPLSAGLARRFVSDRLALVGDAAHEVHPLAGQGLNLGLMDAAALAEHAADAVRLGLDPGGAEALRPYERDRRFDALRLLAVTDGLNRLFSNDLLPFRALRDLGLGLVDRAGGLKAMLLEAAAGTGGRAPRLARGEPL